MIIDENHRGQIPEDFRQQAASAPRKVADQIKTKVFDAGVDGVIFSPVTSLDGYHPGGRRGRREAQAGAAG